MDESPRGRSGFRAWPKTCSFVFSALPIVTALAAWEACAIFSGSRFVPHLSALASVIVDSFWHDAIITAQSGDANGYAPHVLATLEAFLTCVIAGVSAGFIISIICFPWIATRRAIRDALRPWHIIPPLIVIPIAFALLGPSPITAWFGGAIYAFVSTAILVVAALDQVPVNLIHLATLAGAGPLWIAWRVRAMSVLAVLPGPIKIVGSFTLGVVVMLEYLAEPAGIGRVMKFAIAYNAIGLILAGVFWATLIGYIFGVGIDLASRAFLRWAPSAHAANTIFNLLDTQRLAGK